MGLNALLPLMKNSKLEDKCSRYTQ